VRTQDSGHSSYGVIDADGRRWFVKTTGDDVGSPGGATRQERAAALRHAAAIQEALDHPALVALEAVIEASDGVYRWFNGELLRSRIANVEVRRGFPPRLSLEESRLAPAHADPGDALGRSERGQCR